MSTLERRIEVVAPAEATWSVLADFGALAEWVPMIQHSCLLSEQATGVGAVRRVQIARQTLVETVITWDEPRELAYSVTGLPPVVGAVTNTWGLAPTAAGTGVVLTTCVETGPNPLKLLVAKKLLERMAIASDFMLAGLARAAATSGVPADAPADRPTDKEGSGA